MNAVKITITQEATTEKTTISYDNNNTAFVPLPNLFSNHLFDDGYYDDDDCANEYFSRTLLESRQYLIHIYADWFIE